MLQNILEHCHYITESYLNIPTNITDNSPIILETQKRIQETKDIFLNEILPFWNPALNNISISYNGGKDCQVLLIIYLACLYDFFMNQSSDSKLQKEGQFKADLELVNSKINNIKIKGVYIKQCETFDILEDFVESSSQWYDLDMYTTNVGKNMKDALREYLDYLGVTESPHEGKLINRLSAGGDLVGKLDNDDEDEEKRKALAKYGIIIGIRRTDPYALNLRDVQETDVDWPCFMRLQPLLDWKLQNVWSFLLYSNEPFCKLYELGYTSIGGIKNTLKNPVLNKHEHKNVWNHFQWEESKPYRTGTDADIEKNENSRILRDQLVQKQEIVKTDQDHELVCNSCDFYPGWYLINDDQERQGRI